ncbi:MAG: ECF transporter S component [Clostridiales bacterium]|nr:ECF transporter S component [Clostridiales bacterium]
MAQSTELRKTNPTRWLTVTALLMAINVVLSSFGLPVPGGHLYLNDIVICTAAILLDPLGAFVVGGIGAFLGDLLFYPTPMFVSLATHGLQAVVISICVRKLPFKNQGVKAAIGVFWGAVIMVAGYTCGRAFLYSTIEYAILKLPFQILQAAVGAIVSLILCFNCGLLRLWSQMETL